MRAWGAALKLLRHDWKSVALVVLAVQSFHDLGLYAKISALIGTYDFSLAIVVVHTDWISSRFVDLAAIGLVAHMFQSHEARISDRLHQAFRACCGQWRALLLLACVLHVLDALVLDWILEHSIGPTVAPLTPSSLAPALQAEYRANAQYHTVARQVLAAIALGFFFPLLPILLVERGGLFHAAGRCLAISRNRVVALAMTALSVTLLPCILLIVRLTISPYVENNAPPAFDTEGLLAIALIPSALLGLVFSIAYGCLQIVFPALVLAMLTTASLAPHWQKERSSERSPGPRLPVLAGLKKSIVMSLTDPAALICFAMLIVGLVLLRFVHGGPFDNLQVLLSVTLFVFITGIMSSRIVRSEPGEDWLHNGLRLVRSRWIPLLEYSLLLVLVIVTVKSVLNWVLSLWAWSGPWLHVGVVLYCGLVAVPLAMWWFIVPCLVLEERNLPSAIQQSSAFMRASWRKVLPLSFVLAFCLLAAQKYLFVWKDGQFHAPTWQYGLTILLLGSLAIGILAMSQSVYWSLASRDSDGPAEPPSA